jgi:hypothetical protein
MHMRMKSRWAASIGIVGILGVGAAAGLVDAAGAASSSSSVVQHTVNSSVSTATFSFKVSVNGLAKSAVKLTGTGQADFANDAVSLTVDVPAVVAKLIPGGPASPEVVNAVLAHGTVYLEIPSLHSLVGAPWISVALPTTTASAVPRIFTKVAAALGDVNTIVQLAQSHHLAVTSLGTATVDGVQATGTKVVATVPLKRTTANLTTSQWADSSDRLVQASVTAVGGSKKKSVDLTATINLSGYGDPVTITVPQPSQVKAIPFSTVESILGKFLHHARRG